MDAEKLFEKHFSKSMMNKNINGFKRDFRTLYNKVIIPAIKEALGNEKQTINTDKDEQTNITANS